MKKFLVVLLSLGLIVAFGATASAVDVKFSGSYYVVGVYDNNVDLIKVQTYRGVGIYDRNNVGQLRSQADPTGKEGGYSRAFFSQRLRIMPVFQIAEGLSLTTRFDALEKMWGNTNWKGGVAETTTNRTSLGGNGALAQENIEFERAYVTFKTKIGQFDVGYMSAAAWGSTFADSETTKPRIKYTFQAGPLVLLGIFEKAFESSGSTAAGFQGRTDVDSDNYYLAAVYNFKQGSAGLLGGYLTNNSTTIPDRVWTERDKTLGNPEWERLWTNVDYANNPFKTKVYLLEPHFKGTFGPLFVEAEVDYFWGTAREYTQPSGLAYPLIATSQVPAAMRIPGTRVINGVTYEDGTAYPSVGSDLWKFNQWRTQQITGMTAAQIAAWDDAYAKNNLLRPNQDVTMSGLGAFLHLKLNIGPAYVGTQLAYASGDDFSDPSKSTTLSPGAGADWNPALLLLNDDYAGWGGGNYGVGSLATSGRIPATVLARLKAEKTPDIIALGGVPNNNKQNTRWFNFYGGFNPTPKLNTELALTFAQVDKKEILLVGATPSGRIMSYDAWGNRINPVMSSGSNSLGMELDVKASYKIYDNLTYMIGAGYLWTGDYYKFGMDAVSVDNNYLLMNKLTLSF